MFGREYDAALRPPAVGSNRGRRRISATDHRRGGDGTIVGDHSFAPDDRRCAMVDHYRRRIRPPPHRLDATMPTTTMPMLETYPKSINLDLATLANTIDTLIACSEACTACADACLSEDTVAELTKCIRTDLDCADICATTARVLSRHTGYDANISRTLLEACAMACASCAEECGRHATMHEHCRICADACRTCEQTCRQLLATMA
jgi:hypothetical protein